VSDLLSRMIERSIRPVSKVEPILASRYEPEPAALTIRPHVPSELNRPAAPIGPKAESIDPKAEEMRFERPVESPAPTSNRMPDPVLPIVKDARPEATVVSTIQEAIEGRPPNRSLKTEPLSSLTAIDASRETQIQTERNEVPVTERTAVQGVAIAPSEARDQPSGFELRTPLVEQRPTDPVEVHVSIGHIEVRAAAPPKTPVRRSPPPRVSLNDYLKRRNEGAQ
jgi:hypothetical protein